jgi:formate dehydrogenase iron-sulfur subunit
VGALHKTALGPVAYDAYKCMGCRYCMLACPFGVPKYEWNNSLTPRVQKCIMCSDRVEKGQVTACVEACPTGATKFGERDALLEEAHKRIHDNPGTYVNNIYGEHEVGGTSVLLLSSVPFENFGYRNDLVKDPLPMYTYRVLSRIPDFLPLAGALLGGTWRITHRREEVAAAEASEKEAMRNGGAK